MYGEGISKEGCILDIGVAAGVISKSGTWYNYGEDRIGQGRENAKKYLRDNPEVRDKVESEIRDILFDNDETESDEAKADSAPIEE